MLLAFILSLVLVEGIGKVLRIRFPPLAFEDAIGQEIRTWMFIPSEDRVYKLTDIPGNMNIYNSTSSREDWAVDEFGFRPDFRANNDIGSGTKVIVMVGDSYTYSHGATHLESYPAQLEKMLLDNGQDVNVINAGVPGYGADQIYNYSLSLVNTYHPAVFIWNLHENDLDEANDYCLYRKDSVRGYTQLPHWKNNVYRQGKALTYMGPWVNQTFIGRMVLFLIGFVPGGDAVATAGCSNVLSEEVEREMAEKTVYFVTDIQKRVEQEKGTMNIILMPFQHFFNYGMSNDEGEMKRRKMYYDAFSRNNQSFIDVNTLLADKYDPAVIDLRDNPLSSASAVDASMTSIDGRIKSFFLTEEEEPKAFVKHMNSTGYKEMAEILRAVLFFGK